jgi:hypothetical protein
VWKEQSGFFIGRQQKAAKRLQVLLLMPVDRLTRDGYLKREAGIDLLSKSDRYLLTTSGEQQLERGRGRRNLLVSQFIEDAHLDESFRKFLKGPGSPGAI